jgi:signal transduction histidine kinase/ligand-binding sensor domain-containing protein
MRACALCVAAVLAMAGAARAQDGVGSRRVRFHTYTTTDGLSQATARAIVQDRDGFIWIGTQDGLSRFDGYGFRVYKHDRSAPWTLAQNHVWALLADPDGSLWIGTQAGGLNRYDPALDRFTVYEPAEKAQSSGSKLVSALLLDRDGRVWVANGSGRLRWVDREHGGLVDTPLGASGSLQMVRAMLQARDGSIWLGTYQGLFRTDARAQALTEVRGDGGQSLDVYALAQTPNGDLWVGTAEAGLYEFGQDGAAVAHFRRDQDADSAYSLPDDEVRALLANARGELWIGGNSRGLARFDPRTRQFVRFEHDATRDDTIAANRISSLARDRSGLLLAGTWTNGFSIHDPRTRAFALIDQVADGAVLRAVPSQTVQADADGTLWVGITSGGGLMHIDLSGQVLRRYVHDPAVGDSLAHDFVQYVTRTSDGSLWVATLGGGLERLKTDGSGFEHLRHDPADPASLASDQVLFATLDRAGTLWVGTLDAGLDERCAGCRGFEHHRHDPADPASAAGDAVSCIRELRNGQFWVSYRSEGLDRLDRKTGRFTHFRSRPGDADSLGSDSVMVLAEDMRGDLWVGTQGAGLAHAIADGGGGLHFEAIDSRDGLAADAIGAIVETSPGTMWVSTTAGISRIDRTAGGQPRIVNYGGRDGAQPRGYWVNSVSRLPDGRIAFGGLDGISVLDTVAVRPAPVPRPVITGLLLSNAPVALSWSSADSPLSTSPWHGGGVVLKHYQDNVTFEFSALEYSDPESVLYAYRLVGHDERWIAASADRRLATYTDLAAGNYQLRVRARHSGEDWAQSEASIDVRVLPAPWRSPLAYAAYAGALALAAMLLLLGTRRSLRRRAAVQEEIRHSAERLKLALWSSGSELWDVDMASGRIVRENRLPHLAANEETSDETLAAYTPFVHPDDLPGFNAALQDHLRGRTETFECSYRTLDRNHNWVWILTRGRAQRDADGRAVRLSGTNHDIDHLKSAEEALRALNEQLESRVEQRTADLRETNLKLRGTLDILTLAQRQLVETEKLASLGGMVAGIAHEINTPIGISVTAASHLQDEARRLSRQVSGGELTRGALERFEHTARESTDIVLRNLRRADRLVKSFKQVAVDQSSEERRVVDLGKSLEEIVTTLGPTLKSASCRIELSCLQLIIMETAPGALYQIITNLVMNSLTHGFAADTAGTIRIDVRRDESAVRIDYRDNGRGMEENVRKRIFEPFFTTRRGQGGSGLGMHIVYNLVTQSLHGTIDCVSAPGQGALFHIVLPIPPATKSEKAPPRRHEDHEGEQGGSAGLDAGPDRHADG